MFVSPSTKAQVWGEWKYNQFCSSMCTHMHHTSWTASSELSVITLPKRKCEPAKGMPHMWCSNPCATVKGHRHIFFTHIPLNLKVNMNRSFDFLLFRSVWGHKNNFLNGWSWALIKIRLLELSTVPTDGFHMCTSYASRNAFCIGSGGILSHRRRYSLE